ncbi:putative general amidase GmdA [Sarocladium strictum]
MAITSWQEQARKKRESILAAIPPEWRLPQPLPSAEEQRDVTGPYVQQFLSAREVEITESDAVTITKYTTTGKWTATEVVSAFCHRAALAHQLTNCLHEIFFDQAIAHARKLDSQFAAGNGPIGPLHGLPVSFKDQFHVKGVETTMGYVGWIDTFEGVKGTGKERNFDSELVRELKAMGAVPFCKSSLPHTVMSGVTWNNIVGFTLNPRNRLMSCGGSSGGEGALISMRGSPVGIGTDIGGSIRTPSAFNGLYGIRPSFGRIPYGGVANSMPGQNTVPSVCGPIATSAGSLKLMMKSILSQQPWLHDPAVVDLPWREERYTAWRSGDRLAFGLLRTDLDVNPQPPVKRAFDAVVDAITAMGHEVIEWNPPSHHTALALAVEAFTADAGLDIFHHIGLSGETLMEVISEIYLGETGKLQAPKTADQIWDTNVRLRKFQKEYMDYWNSTAKMTSSGKPVVAVLSPVSAVAAYRFDKTNPSAFTPWVNTLDYTSVAFPVTQVHKDIDVLDVNYKPISDSDREIWEQYDPELQHGTPVGLQLVGRRLEEEKILGLVGMISEALSLKDRSA